jgi:hypothetical protein
MQQHRDGMHKSLSEKDFALFFSQWRIFFLPPTRKDFLKTLISFISLISKCFFYFSTRIYLPVSLLEAKLHIIFKKSKKQTTTMMTIHTFLWFFQTRQNLDEITKSNISA